MSLSRHRSIFTTPRQIATNWDHLPERNVTPWLNMLSILIILSLGEPEDLPES